RELVEGLLGCIVQFIWREFRGDHAETRQCLWAGHVVRITLFDPPNELRGRFDLCAIRLVIDDLAALESTHRFLLSFQMPTHELCLPAYCTPLDDTPRLISIRSGIRIEAVTQHGQH